MQLKKTHDAAFFIVERVYGERPRFSYFVGTSQGGREGLTVVQRYPADYDGVVSMVPIVSFTTLMLAPELIRIHEKPLANWVPPAKAAAIRAEFMRQCDSLDGLADGVINNYMACRAIFAVSAYRARSSSVGVEALPGQRRPQPGGCDSGGVPDGWTDLDARAHLQAVSIPGAAGSRRQRNSACGCRQSNHQEAVCSPAPDFRVRRAQPPTRSSTLTSEFSE